MNKLGLLYRENGKIRYTKIAVFVLLALTLAVFGVSCKKPTQRVDEDKTTYKKRLTAIYTAQIASGIDGMSDVVNVLTKNGVLSSLTASTLIQINNKSADTWVVLKDRLKNGFTDNATIVKIQDIVTDIERLEAEGIVGIKSDEAKRRFRLVTAGFKTTLTALKNVLIAVNGPAFNTALEQANKETVQTAKMTARSFAAVESDPAVWAFELSNIVLNCFGRAAQQSWLPNEAAAYMDGELIIQALKIKNAERLTQYAMS